MTEQEKQKRIRVTNIQRFCLHDGPGIRTTVFLKGCSIHCPWCANPENIHYCFQNWKDEKGNTGIYGRDISLLDTYEILMRDKIFYLDKGGVTFSGGEPLLQIKQYEPLLRKLKNERISLTIETALFVDAELLKASLPYFDSYYVDMKLLEPQFCKDILGGDICQYRRNLQILRKNAAHYCVRIPCVHGFTDRQDNLKLMAEIIREYEINNIEIFAAHNLAQKKYMTLGLEQLTTEKNDLALEKVKKTLERNKIPYHVIQI